MKKLFFIPFILVTILYSDELLWVDEQIEAIKPTRKGLQNSDILSLRDPFIFLQKNTYQRKLNTKIKFIEKNRSNKKVRTYKKIYKAKKKNKIRYVKLNVSLNAIMNKSVLVDSQWYKIGDSIKGFKIIRINSNTVTLAKKNKRAVLSIKSKVKKLNFGIN